VHNLFLGDVVSQIKSGFIAGIATQQQRRRSGGGGNPMPLYVLDQTS
jgi:hypothetical protein